MLQVHTSPQYHMTWWDVSFRKLEDVTALELCPVSLETDTRSADRRLLSIRTHSRWSADTRQFRGSHTPYEA
jgi:hypothetical protein